jgi:hypothetical protein
MPLHDSESADRIMVELPGIYGMDRIVLTCLVFLIFLCIFAFLLNLGRLASSQSM